MNIASLQFTAFLVLFVVNFSFAADKKPDWIEKRPVTEGYFVGIGIAQKGKDNRDYIQSAKNNALGDLSSEIAITISSEFIDIVVEQSGLAEEEVRSEIRSSTKENLEGYEIVDTWEDKNEYWVYYRLSKELYYAQKQSKVEKAISLALDMFSKAQANEKGNNITRALLFYLQSLIPLQEYVGEPLETYYDGSKIFLMNEIYSSLQRLLSRIELIVNKPTRDAKIGQPLKKPLEVTIIYTRENGDKISVSNLPLKFSFIRGSGELVEKIKSDASGRAKCQISKITATDRIQIVKAKLDISSLLNQDSLGIILQIIKSLPTPSAKFVLNVSGLSVFIEADEINLGKRLDVPYIEPTLKNALSNHGFTFIDEMSKADIFIELKAESRKGAEVHGISTAIYTAFVDLTISVLDMNSGDEIYKNCLQNVNGGHLDYTKAGLKAFENAATQISEKILPDLIERVQK